MSRNTVKNAILLVLTGAILTSLAFNLSASPQISSPPPPTLSLEVVRKAEEVEKLAKRVKDKMREGTGKPMKAEPLVVDPRHEHQ